MARRLPLSSSSVERRRREPDLASLIRPASGPVWRFVDRAVDRLDCIVFLILAVHLAWRAVAQGSSLLGLAALTMAACGLWGTMDLRPRAVLVRSCVAVVVIGTVMWRASEHRLEFMPYVSSLGILTALMVGIRLAWPVSAAWASIAFSASWFGLEDRAGGFVRAVVTMVGAVIAGLLAERRLYAEHALRTSEERRLRRQQSTAATLAVLEDSPVAVTMQTGARAIHFANARAADELRADPGDLIRNGWGAVLDDENLARLQAAFAAAEAGQIVIETFELPSPGAGRRWVDVVSAPMIGPGGISRGSVSTVRDATDEVEARATMQHLRAIAEATPDIVGISDARGAVEFLNPQGRRFFGVPADVHSSVLGLLTPASGRILVDTIVPAIATSGSWVGELEVLGASGAAVAMSSSLLALRDPDGALTGYAAVFRDISDRKRMEDQLAHQALHDGLTELPNREHLYRSIGEWTERGLQFAVLFGDLDGFKPVNDSLGHHVGDRLLQHVARRLRLACREGDVVGRLGGDEFVLLCPLADGASADDAAALAARVIERIRRPIELDGRVHVLSMSIGVAVSSPGELRDDIIEDADIALYRAKRAGRGEIVLFDESMRREIESGLELEDALRHAVRTGRITAHFQPIVQLDTREVTHLEALARWSRDDGQVVEAGRFIAAAARAGLLDDIAVAMLDECIRVVTMLRASGQPIVTAGVNLSPEQLFNDALLEEMTERIQQAGLADRSITFEITEDALTADVVRAREVLQRLQQFGVRIALDDFGTGYSNLAALRRLPADALKIDREFTDGILDDSGDRQIVQLLVALGAELGISVVAEGVETAEQADLLGELGCSFGQGYFFGRAAPADALVARLAALHPSPTA